MVGWALWSQAWWWRAGRCCQAAASRRCCARRWARRYRTRRPRRPRWSRSRPWCVPRVYGPASGTRLPRSHAPGTQLQLVASPAARALLPALPALSARRVLARNSALPTALAHCSPRPRASASTLHTLPASQDASPCSKAGLVDSIGRLPRCCALLPCLRSCTPPWLGYFSRPRQAASCCARRRRWTLGPRPPPRGPVAWRRRHRTSAAQSTGGRRGSTRRARGGSCAGWWRRCAAATSQSWRGG